MPTIQMMVAATAVATLTAAWPIPASAEIDWTKVDAVLATTSAKSGEVRRYGLPRSDLNVTLDGVMVKPGFALGGWVAFEPMGEGAMLMGDLVLLDTEINPVMTKLLSAGLEVTAVHNHLLRASPPTFYMHVAGEGDPLKLAQSVRDALAFTQTPFNTASATASPTPSIDLDTAKIDETIGFKGHANSGVYQFGVPRSDKISQGGVVIPGGMGTAIAINFQPTGDGKAAITGDFVALADEVNPLIKALRDNSIEVTAIHNHMLNDQPRAFFIHFWANDDALKLAKGLRAGLDAIHVAPNG